MKIAQQSLKIRNAILFSSLIALILLLNAVLVIYLKYGQFESDIEQRAITFAKIAVKPVCDGYDSYYQSSYFKFRESIKNLMSSEPDLTRIRVLDLTGKLLFDSNDLLDTNFVPQLNPVHSVTKGAYFLHAIQQQQMSQRKVKDAQGNENLEIISPFVDEWGKHKYSVIMNFSYFALYPQIKMMIYQVGGLTLLSLFFTSLLAWIVTSRITKPLDRLTERAKSMIGSFEEREIPRSENEIQLLTNTFNLMTSRIQETIQELEENNVKLAGLNEELKELDRLKSDLLANVSHELRTPLTSIKGYTEYILDGKLGPISEKQQKGLVVMERNLERLSKLINALIDYSLMDAARMPIVVKPFALHPLCRQISANLSSELEKKNLQLAVNIHDNMPLLVGDKDKIYQVLENLTINAMKFTEQGGSVTLSAIPHEEEGQLWVRIDVTDTGIGISQNALPRIFDRFYQADATSKRKYGGMGLGLAIAKSIIDAHQGRIRVQSAVGQGTTFTLILPAYSEYRPDLDEIPRTGPEEYFQQQS
jgi:signal transduction histidine kinase